MDAYFRLQFGRLSEEINDGLPYDLSDVMFLTTANTLGGIPIPLQDRMEIIQLSGLASHRASFRRAPPSRP